jgi:cysteine desulfurase
MNHMLTWVRKVYLDHAATTPILPAVRRELAKIAAKAFGNAASLHSRGRQARGIVDQARRSVADLLGCHPERILFVSGGTEANNAVVKGVFLQAGGKGHIITSSIEHESVLGACRQVERLGARVTRLAAERDGRVLPEHVKAALRPDTILISVMHANNETGAIQPVNVIGAIARDAGVPLHVDAVQSAGKIPIRVDEIGCEFLTLSAHKINGPKGVGALFWQGGAGWQPLVYGGDQEQGMRAGTEAMHQIAAFGLACRLATQRMDAECKRLAALRERLLKQLRVMVPDLVIHEAEPDKQLPGTLNLAFPGQQGIQLLAGLDCHGVAVSIGSACTADRVEPSHALLGMGVSEREALSSIRVSMGTTTNWKDLAYFLRVLPNVLRGLPQGLAFLDPQHLTEARMQSADTFMVDMRFAYERLLSSPIKGSAQWSPLHIDRHFKAIPKDKEVILICATGYLSFVAGYRLAHFGHPNVKVVYGGYDAWKSLQPAMIGKD